MSLIKSSDATELLESVHSAISVDEYMERVTKKTEFIGVIR